MAEFLNPIVQEQDNTIWKKQAFLKPSFGDCIEFKRDGYCHWALYCGNNNVIHFNPASGEFDKKNAGKSVDGKITIESFKIIAGDSYVRVNNKSTITQLTPETDDVIREKISVLMSNTEYHKIYYRLQVFNCEHFVTFLKFGITFSEQEMALSNIFNNPIYMALKLIAQLAQKQWIEILEACREKREPRFLMDDTEVDFDCIKLPVASGSVLFRPATEQIAMNIVVSAMNSTPDFIANQITSVIGRYFNPRD